MKYAKLRNTIEQMEQESINDSMATVYSIKEDDGAYLKGIETPPTRSYSITNIRSNQIRWNETEATVTFDGVETLTYSDGRTEERVEENITQKFTFEVNTGGNQPTEFTANTDYVDLGMTGQTDDGKTYKILWAKCNLGASNENEPGLYFAWGDTNGYEYLETIPHTTRYGKPQSETSEYKNEPVTIVWNGVIENHNIQHLYPKQGFSLTTTPYQTSITYEKANETTWTKYLGTSVPNVWRDANGTDEDAAKSVLDPIDDAATVHMGEGWRMPTAEELEMLVTSTTITKYYDTTNARYVISANGQTMYLPSPGVFTLYDTKEAVGTTKYWSSSIYSVTKPYQAKALCAYSGRFDMGQSDETDNRCNGYLIRPVKIEFE